MEIEILHENCLTKVSKLWRRVKRGLDKGGMLVENRDHVAYVSIHWLVGDGSSGEWLGVVRVCIAGGKYAAGLAGLGCGRGLAAGIGAGAIGVVGSVCGLFCDADGGLDRDSSGDGADVGGQ